MVSVPRDLCQNSFTLEKYVEKLAQLDPRTGLGPLSKSHVEPFDAQVGCSGSGGLKDWCTLVL